MEFYLTPRLDWFKLALFVQGKTYEKTSDYK